MKKSSSQTLVEQIALLFASLVWTVVILAMVVLFWVYQDIQARWDYVLTAPPEALAQELPPTVTPTPTATLWPGPGPTLTPTATKPPTPTATWVVPPPNFLPETLNPDEPTPVPVIVHTEEEAQEFGLTPPVQEQTPTAPPELLATQPPAQAPPPTPIPATPTPQPAIPAPIAINGNIPTHMKIESVGIDSDVIAVGWQAVEQDGQQYSIWQVADFAVGWHKTTAPLGQPGNTVMAGHHNVNGEVFRDLVNVEVGDKVILYSGDKVFEYRVDLKTIVKEKGEPLDARKRNAQWIAPTNDERLTFVTCWPYTNNTHRVIVVAKPI
jgi:sortase A